MTTALSLSSFLGIFIVNSACGGAGDCCISCAASPSAELRAGFVPLPPLGLALLGWSISMSSVWIDSMDQLTVALLLLAGSGHGSSPPRAGSRACCRPRVLEWTCGSGCVPVLDRDLNAGALPLLDLDPEAAGSGSEAREFEVADTWELEAETTGSEVR